MEASSWLLNPTILPWWRDDRSYGRDVKIIANFYQELLQKEEVLEEKVRFRDLIRNNIKKKVSEEHCIKLALPLYESKVLKVLHALQSIATSVRMCSHPHFSCITRIG